MIMVIVLFYPIELMASAEPAPFLMYQSWHAQPVTSLAFSPDEELLATASLDKTVRVWHMKTGRLLRIFSEHRASVDSVAFSPNGQIIASGEYGKILIWNYESGIIIATLEAQYSLGSIEFSPNGEYVAANFGGWTDAISIFGKPGLGSL
jgi:WD40 repeat protein